MSSIRRFVAGTLLATVMVCLGGSFTATAFSEPNSTGADAGADDEGDSFYVSAEGSAQAQDAPGQAQIAASAGVANVGVSIGPEPPRDSGLDPLCVGQAIEAGRDPFGFCAPPVDPAPPGAPPPAAPPQVTPGMVLTAFRQVPLPASVLQVQPPDGETLVNFETNFYTVAEPFTASVALLGRRVDLRIWPSLYSWHFGDGGTVSGADPGAAYPDLRVTHVYARKGTADPRVDTTWSADYRVAGGPWRRVGGTVTVTGQPQGLRVLEAQPNLTGAG